MVCYRQGDVLIVKVEEAPQGAVRLPREAGRLVLAHGEATGHAHVIVDEEAELVNLEQAEELYLLVYGLEVQLLHDEHDAISVPAGSYRVVRQREYAPPAEREDVAAEREYFDYVYD